MFDAYRICQTQKYTCGVDIVIYKEPDGTPVDSLSSDHILTCISN